MVDNENMVASLKALQTLYDAALVRPRRTIRVDPILLPPLQAEDPAARFGALVVVLAEEGSAAIRSMREASSRSPEEIRGLLIATAEELGLREQIAISDAIAVARQLPSLVDIRHGSQPLASNVPILPGGSPTIYTFPYRGGDLASAGITIVERYRESPTVEVFSVLAPPILTQEQEDIIKLLGDDDRESLISPPSMCYAASAVGVAMVVEAVAIAATAWGIAPDVGDVIDATLPSGEQTSVNDLLRERRNRLRVIRSGKAP